MLYRVHLAIGVIQTDCILDSCKLFQKHVGRTKYFPLKVLDSWMVEVVDILSQAEYHDVGSLSYIKLKWYCSFENRIRSFQNR
jgi:hypothetical protein